MCLVKKGVCLGRGFVPNGNMALKQDHQCNSLQLSVILILWLTFFLYNIVICHFHHYSKLQLDNANSVYSATVEINEAFLQYMVRLGFFALFYDFCINMVNMIGFFPWVFFHYFKNEHLLFS